MQPGFINYFSPKKEWIFLPIFYSLFMLYLWVTSNTFELLSFPKETISAATLNKFDINQRVASFYRAIPIFIFLFLAISGGLNTIWKKNWLNRYSFLILNYTSAFALVLLYALVMHKTNNYLLDLLLIFQVLILIQEIIYTRFYRSKSFINRKDLYIWSLIISFSLLFPIREFYSFRDLKIDLAVFYKLFFFLNIIIINASYFLLAKNKQLFKLIVSQLKPIAWFPFASIISFELYIILSNVNNNWITPANAYLLVSGLLITRIILNSFSKRKRKGLRYILSFSYIPIFIFGIFSFLYYSPTIPQSEEIFEMANPANAMMRVFDFGEIPMVDFLSSHLLSEQLFSFVYALFNGYEGDLSFMVYHFLLKPLSFLFLYYFLHFIFKNPVIAIILVLLFPYVNQLLPISQSIILISILLCYKLTYRYSLKTLIANFIWIAFLLGWKPEIGLANLYLYLIYFIILLTKKYSKSLLIDFAKAGSLMLFLSVAIIIVVSFYSDSNILVNLKKAYGYFTANQAHGLSSLAFKANRYLSYHYYIFPFIILGISIWLLPYYIKQKSSVFNSRILLSIFLITIIYFVTAQRGLVRHNMFSSSMRISGFLMLLIGMFLVFISNVKMIRCKGLVFLVSTAFLVSNFSYPEKQAFKAPFETCIKKFVEYKNNEDYTGLKYSRIQESNFIESNFAEITSFLDKNLDSTSTFYDFSNTPMMYFYTKKSIPSYFNQMPICVINRELQELHLTDLHKYDIPVAFISNIPKRFWDRVDGVPNELRHILIANWLYSSYSPYAILNKHTTWIKNDQIKHIEKTNERELINTITSKKSVSISNLDTLKAKHIIARIKTKTNFSYPEWFIVNNQVIQAHRISDKGYQDIYIRDEWKKGPLKLSFKDTILGIYLLELKFCPDTVSYASNSFKIKKLAYIEGEYSNKSIKEKIEINSFEAITPNSIFINSLPLENKRKAMKFIELIVAPVKSNKSITCQYGINEKQLGEINFDLIPSGDTAKYHVPVYSQLNWHTFPINYLRITSNKEFSSSVLEVGLIKK